MKMKEKEKEEEEKEIEKELPRQFQRKDISIVKISRNKKEYSEL